MIYNGSNLHKINLRQARLSANRKETCRFCGEKKTLGNLPRHERACVFNPDNLRFCPVCSKPIVNRNKKSTARRGTTCSHACANTFYRSGKNHPNWNPDKYRNACREAHDFKCVVCGEFRIISVHHVDHKRTNSSPENLVPLCPTHHQYWHSRHRHLIEKKVFDYLTKWKAGVWRSGSASRLGREGRPFESDHPDQLRATAR